MAQITQHRPAYFSGFENETTVFNSLEELLNIKWVDRFSKLPSGEVRPEFYQYSISKDSSGSALMVEYDNGHRWFVVGFLDENEITKELPTWTPKYKDDPK